MIKMFHEGHRRVKINKLDLEMHRTGRHIIMQEKNNGITHIFMSSIWQMFKDVCAVDTDLYTAAQNQVRSVAL